MVNQFQIIGGVRSLITHSHIHDYAGHVTLVFRTGLPSVVGLVTACGTRISGWGRVIGYCCSAIVEVFVALGGIYCCVAGTEMVQVCSGGGCVAKTSVALAPGVFLVPVGGIASIGIGIDAPAGVELDHIVGIVGILVSVLELICCRCIGILGGVSGAQKVVQNPLIVVP